jgi:hypothetical protein
MNKDVALSLFADQETEAARGVEPFHRAGELDQRLVFRSRAIAAPVWGAVFRKHFSA